MQTYNNKMADHVNLCDDEIEGNSEIASEENNKDNKEESENSANILVYLSLSLPLISQDVCKLNTKSVVWSYFISRQEKMGFLYAMK